MIRQPRLLAHHLQIHHHKKNHFNLWVQGCFSGGLWNEALIGGIFPVFDDYSWNIPNKFSKQKVWYLIFMLIVLINFIPLKFNPPCNFLQRFLISHKEWPSWACKQFWKHFHLFRQVDMLWPKYYLQCVTWRTTEATLGFPTTSNVRFSATDIFAVLPSSIDTTRAYVVLETSLKLHVCDNGVWCLMIQ